MAGYLLVLAAAALWSLLGVLSRGALDAGVQPLEIAFWRAGIGGAAFVVHALATGSLRLQRRRDGITFAGFSLLGVSLFYVALVAAIDSGGISLAFVLLYTAPAFVALLARPLLGEPLTRRKLALVAVAMAGVALVAQDHGHGITATPTSLGWGLLSGVAYASYYLFGKWILRRYRPEAVYAFVMPLGALGLLPLVDFQPKAPAVWALLLVMGLLSTYAAYFVYYTGLRRVEASRAVLVATVEPVLASLLAAAFYGERFGAAGLAGGACILTAAALAALSGSGPGADRPPAPGRTGADGPSAAIDAAGEGR
ncbi:MAG TPA: EamA family transporter [Thermoanaerobaculia bacterium]|nr:EamA family transporter [Thermoanaerobaculia bacterium]